jgi:CHAT domain-containing protein
MSKSLIPACWTLLWMLDVSTVLASPTPGGAWQQDIRDGIRARELGNMNDSIAALERAARETPEAASRVYAHTELGVSLAQTGRLADARVALENAYREADSHARTSVALALGNLAVRSHDSPQAERYYQDAIASASADETGEDAKLGAELNLAWLQPPLQRMVALEALLPRVESLNDPPGRARALFVLGVQASEALEQAQLTRSPDVDRALRLSYRGLRAAQQWAQQAGDVALRADAADAIAQLYESQGRLADAEEINRGGIDAAGGLPEGQAPLRLVRLEWRAARLAQRRGDSALAIAHYMRAAQRLEAIHQDLPVEDARGRSTFQTLQRPVIAGLTDLLLQDVDTLGPDVQQARLASALRLTEQAHQAELQDYLGDRCSVESLRPAGTEAVAAGVALVYPIILKDRLEVIVRTHDALLHHAAPVSAAALGAEIQSFRSAMLDIGSSDYLQSAQHLQAWLIAPFATRLAQADVHALVVVPDSFLRLVPFAALHDGQQFLAQRYWISTVTGMTMTEPAAPRRKRAEALFVGLSIPGPVVDRLLALGFHGADAPASSADRRTLQDSGAEPPPAASFATRELTLRSQLALPGVQTEIQDLAPLTRSVWLLNDQFTVGRFEHEVQSGNYSVVHIASHSFFGGNAGDSFLLAYDNVIRIDQLQQLIAANDSSAAGIDLLTLSACDTATGDERAPLGFAGAAIKAQARSVLGSLWPVSDTATQQFMELFYQGLAHHLGKSQAFTEAQRALMDSTQFSHPYYWAPFILTGDWN